MESTSVGRAKCLNATARSPAAVDDCYTKLGLTFCALAAVQILS
jgi:hypothetical protein